MKSNYEKGDVVETPFGPGKITYLHEPTGNCNVRLNTPISSASGTQYDITATTFQLGVILKPAKKKILKVTAVV